ncbi:putative sugar transporter [Phaeomoniella chlamydospora]|uniref:Putative sugar transporter n=1 Tax=Phaeomoniella chlamydospora TaxID=158046 RepID=A0A0G2F0U5_PHACM|nr:putative sugar transporter [Phaeomoniella chlamydospora]
MGANPSDTGATNAVGDALTAVLPQDGKPWYKRGHLIALNFAIISLVMFSSANGFDGSLMNGLQALDQWQAFMDSPTGSWLGLINAVYWLGAGITYPAAAWISNTYGRKPGIYLGYVFLILGSVLQTAAQNDVQFILARMFVGIASALLGSGAPLLINEIAYPTQRGVTSALFMCGWYVGGTIAAFATFATRNYTSSWAWRVPSILQLLLPLVALPGLIMAPESPRWLISVDRPEEAREILVKYHAGGDPDSALVNYEIIEIGATLRAEKEAHNSASYKDMIKTPGNRHRLFISVTLGVFSQWSGNGHVTYYLSLVLDTVGVTSVTDQTLISGFLQVWNLILSVAAAFSVDKFGRRPLFLASAAIMLVSYILMAVIFDRDSSKVPNAEETVYRSLSAGGAQEAAEKEGSLYKHTEKV